MRRDAVLCALCDLCGKYSFATSFRKIASGRCSPLAALLLFLLAPCHSGNSHRQSPAPPDTSAVPVCEAADGSGCESENPDAPFHQSAPGEAPSHTGTTF